MPGMVSKADIVASAAGRSIRFARPKSSTFTRPSGDHDVRRLDVAMHDAGGVRGLERRGDLCPVLQRSRQRQRPLAEQCGERYAVDELHGDEGRPLVLADFVNRDDVGMVQRRSGASFLNEAAMPVGIGGGVGGKDFDRDPAAETGVNRAVNDAHSSPSDFPFDAVVRDDH